MSPQPLEPLSDKSLSERVADELRDAIQGGEYPPGTRLVERRLAADLGVSHIPVREALARLADEGLVEHAPRRGARVAGLNAKLLEELCSIRILHEQFVAIRVQERLTPASESELRKLVEQMARAADRGDVHKIFEIDQQFHERLWTLADHELLSEFVSQLRGRISAFLRATTEALEDNQLDKHVEAHRELVDAIAGGDPAAARETMARHIQVAAERLSQAFVHGGTSKAGPSEDGPDD